MKDRHDWIELEYTNLRQEILTLSEASRSAIRFYLPAAAAVYAVPYLLQRTADPFLWSFCAALAGLLLFTLTRSLLFTISGSRRIGAYIKQVLEPETDGGLRWEHVSGQLVGGPTVPTNESIAVITTAVCGNLLASLGAGVTFLSGWTAFGPVMAAMCLAALTCRSAWRVHNARGEREAYASAIAAAKEGQPKGIASGPTISAG